MDFGFSEEQDLLRQAARDFLTEYCTSAFVRQMMEEERGYSPELWREMAALGWLGLAFPEEYGGQGLGFVDLTVILEEMGAALLPSPFFSSVLLAGQTLLLGGSEDQKKTWLPKIADGSLVATLAMTEPSGRFEAAGIADVQALPAGDGFVISGTKLFVPDAHVADLMVVAARTKTAGDKSFGISLFLVDAAAAGVSVTLLKTMDQTRKQCEVVFDNVAVARDKSGGHAGHGLAGIVEGAAHLHRGAVRRNGRRRAARSRPQRRLRQGARAVRSPDRQLPGHQAQVRRDDAAGGVGEVGGLLRGLGG